VRPDLLAERYVKSKHAARARAAALVQRVPSLASVLIARGARRVVLFGSLATKAEPHAETDVDFCVEGLSERDAGRAALDLEELAGARVDIVCWEFASPAFKRMIQDRCCDVTSEAEELLRRRVAG
jgi:predicted nucleotidyltransferase